MRGPSWGTQIVFWFIFGPFIVGGWVLCMAAALAVGLIIGIIKDVVIPGVIALARLVKARRAAKLGAMRASGRGFVRDLPREQREKLKHGPVFLGADESGPRDWNPPSDWRTGY